MPVSVLEKKIQALPQEYIDLVADYVELLEYKIKAMKEKNKDDEISQKIACSSMNSMWEELKNDTW